MLDIPTNNLEFVALNTTTNLMKLLCVQYYSTIQGILADFVQMYSVEALLVRTIVLF